jgi:hypothetical protein
MSEFQVDFKGVVDRSNFEGGNYSFEVSKAEGDSGPNGPYVRVTLTFLDGKYAGLHMEDIVSLAPKALWRAKAFLRSLGYDVPDGPFRFRSEDLISLRFKGVCTRETDPAGKYPPKLRVNEYHTMDWSEPPTVHQAQSPAPEGGPTTGGNGDAASQPPPPPPPQSAVAVSRPKLKV